MNPLERLVNRAWAAKVLADTGVIRPTRPDKLLRIGLTLQRWGPTPAAARAAVAVSRSPASYSSSSTRL